MVQSSAMHTVPYFWPIWVPHSAPTARARTVLPHKPVQCWLGLVAGWGRWSIFGQHEQEMIWHYTIRCLTVALSHGNWLPMDSCSITNEQLTRCSPRVKSAAAHWVIRGCPWVSIDFTHGLPVHKWLPIGCFNCRSSPWVISSSAACPASASSSQLLTGAGAS